MHLQDFELRPVKCNLAPMQHARLRPAQPSDHALLAAVGQETFIETYLPLHANDLSPVFAHAMHAYAESRLRSEWERGETAYWFLEVEGQCAGFCKLRSSPRPPMLPELPTVELQRIYLRKAFQGQGWGSFMLRGICQIAREKGYRQLWLGVWPENTAAVRFYLRQGFQRQGYVAFQLSDRVEQDLLMSRLL
jgi:ribosomal protein S18 acetylase RimI-like enzyme